MTKMILIVLCSKYELEDKRIRRTTIPGISSSKAQVHETKVNNEAILKNKLKDSYFIIFTRVCTPCESCYSTFKIFGCSAEPFLFLIPVLFYRKANNISIEHLF